jgi:hypothetical protein
LSTAMTVAEYWPTRQLMQVLTAIAPSVSEYFPAPQAVQARLPVTALKVPATQGRHGPPFAPLYPTLHKQLVKAVLPAAELELPGQLKQSVDELAPMTEDLPAAQFKHVLDVEAPTVAEYVPAPQSTQPVPAREYLPARQFAQSVDELAPMAEDLPAAQLKHVLGAERSPHCRRILACATVDTAGPPERVLARQTADTVSR